MSNRAVMSAVVFAGSLAVLSTSATLPSVALGQAKPGTAKSPPQPKANKALEPPPPPPVQQVAFVPSNFAKGLPPDFRGVSPAELVAALDDLARQLKKDEYETTAQYEARKATLLSQPLLRNVATSDLLAVAVPEPQARRSYDADQGRMKVEMITEQSLGTVLSPPGFRLANSQIAVRGGTRVKDSKDAIFMNTYGAKWEGKDIFAEESMLLVPAYVPAAVTFSLSQEQARSLRDSKLAVLIVGKLGSRDLVESALSAKASVGSPDDVFILRRACRLLPEEIWVYDVPSGQVLTRLAVSPPPLSRQGIDLGVERLLGDYEMLAPSMFMRVPDASVNAMVVNDVYTAKSVEPVPRLTITGVMSKPIGQRARPDLDGALAEFVKVTEARSKTKLIGVNREEAPVAAMPGKLLTARLESGPVRYAVASRAFECLDLLGQAQLCIVTASLDATLDSADAELGRVMRSLKRREETVARVAGSKKPLGVQFMDVPAQAYGQLGLSSARGVLIVVVATDSVAGKAGLKPGDVLLSLEGTQIENKEGLQKAVANVAPGRVVELKVVRARQEISLAAEF